MFENKQFIFEKQEILGADGVAERIEDLLGERALRWYIAGIRGDDVIVEATLGEKRADYDRLDSAGRGMTGHGVTGRSVAVSIIPTGVGCEVGGYAGDAAPATRLLAATVDDLVTNPNAVNGSNFISLGDNVHYCEGLEIDLFCKGLVDLYKPRANRVGLLIERCSEEALDVVYNVVNTARAIYGVDIVDCVVTEERIGSRCVENASGAFVGTVDNPQVMFRACEALLERGANAIAVTTNIQDLPHDAYVEHFEGRYPNPMGGIEAIISHSIVNRFGVPAAHAPMLNLKELALADNVVDARGAGEMASASGLACVLIGLAKAPHIRADRCHAAADILSADNLLAVVAPATCLGGIPAICAHERGVPIIAVHENATVLEVGAESVGIGHVIEVQSYLEAAGVLTALREGIAIDTVKRPMRTLRPARTDRPQMAELRLAGEAGG
ncbi:MAG: DUF3326 domain-containing protein [Acidobacteriota bacterium]